MTEQQAQEGQKPEETVVEKPKEYVADWQKNSDADDGLHPIFKLPLDHPAIKELEKTRKEAAGNRVKSAMTQEEMAEKAKQWDEYKRSQMTEMEKVAEEKAKLQEELQSLKAENLRNKLLNEFKLDAEFASLLIGDENQMRATAKLLSEKMGERMPDLGLLGGDRGKPVVKQEKSSGARWLEENFR